jgi:hypothetical protein
MAVGDYEQIEKERRRAWKLMRGLYDPEERATNERRYAELSERREQYLRELLARLPFAWHVAHAYTAQETATYGGADHIVVDEPVRIGRLVREPGDALSRPKRKFWGLHEVVEKDRLPTSLADIKIAERVVATPSANKPSKPKKTGKQLDREIAEALDRSRDT